MCALGALETMETVVTKVGRILVADIGNKSPSLLRLVMPAAERMLAINFWWLNLCVENMDWIIDQSDFDLKDSETVVTSDIFSI